MFRVPTAPGKPGKMTSFSSHGNMEFENYEKISWKMRGNLEK